MTACGGIIIADTEFELGHEAMMTGRRAMQVHPVVMLRNEGLSVEEVRSSATTTPSQ